MMQGAGKDIQDLFDVMIDRDGLRLLNGHPDVFLPLLIRPRNAKLDPVPDLTVLLEFDKVGTAIANAVLYGLFLVTLGAVG